MKFFSMTSIVLGMVITNFLYASDEVVCKAVTTEERTVKKSKLSKSTAKSTWAPIIMDDLVTFVPVDNLTLTNTVKQIYLNVINNARAQVQDCGSEGIKPAVAALTWSDELYTAAWQHSNDLAKSFTFSHTGSGGVTDITAQALHPGIGSSVEERIEYNGYVAWLAYGENIAAGTVMDEAQKAIDAWLGSPGHCANIMNPIVTEVGMAHVYDSNSIYTHYWTQDFGRR